MNNKKIIVAAAALLFTLGSCKKETTPSTISKTVALTQSGWKITSVMMSTNGAPAVESISMYPSCFVDNIFTFSANTAFTQTEGLTKCDPTDPDTISTGNWGFISNETFLNITDDSTGGVTSLKIITLDATTFKGEMYDSLSSSNIVYTWKH
jgi:hypothetical protein